MTIYNTSLQFKQRESVISLKSSVWNFNIHLITRMIHLHSYTCANTPASKWYDTYNMCGFVDIPYKHSPLQTPLAEFQNNSLPLGRLRVCLFRLSYTLRTPTSVSYWSHCDRGWNCTPMMVHRWLWSYYYYHDYDARLPGENLTECHYSFSEGSFYVLTEVGGGGVWCIFQLGKL